MQLSKDVLDRIMEAAKEAGEILLDASKKKPEGIAKAGHANFVTMYDEQIQNFLKEKLSRILPEATFIGEEDGLGNPKDSHTGLVYVIDPIDGTSNFMKGYESSVVSIALMESGKPILGVIENPFQKKTFWAIRGQGAFRNGEQIFSSESDLANSLVGFGTAPYYSELHSKTFELCALYLEKGIDLRRSGTAAWDLCLAAQGSTGLFFEATLALWDYAAGALIAEEAGCTVTDLEGNPLQYDGQSSIICASHGVSQGKYLPKDIKE